MNLLFSASSAADLHPPRIAVVDRRTLHSSRGGWMHGASFLVTRDRSPPQIGFLAPLPARSEMSECAITLRRQGEVKTGEKKEKGKNPAGTSVYSTQGVRSAWNQQVIRSDARMRCRSWQVQGSLAVIRPLNAALSPFQDFIQGGCVKYCHPGAVSPASVTS